MELYFNMSYEILGQTRTVDLVAGGSSIPVTDANKADYINKVFYMNSQMYNRTFSLRVR